MTATCKRCGSVLSAVTWTCVMGRHCGNKKLHIPGGRVDLPGQLDLPQTEPRPADLAKLQAKAPLRSAKAQKACDVGLFSDDAKQIDLL